MIAINKPRIGAYLITILVASFAMGYGLAYLVQTQNIWPNSKKPAVHITEPMPRITENTPILFKKEYILSARVFEAEFTDKNGIIGMSLAQVREKYSPANGFSVSWQDKTLLILQKINDWSPQDKGKTRLKKYREMVAVYRGPDSHNDTLWRVTAIRFDTLPAQIQKGIEDGKYEFMDDQALNDTLENMDEYI
ncbi:hypothetical protein [Syntrophomonas zehnderi]|uniref:hypothetical protein n=1 Tax=Syntrophomonas zehnderi TaxID=404335 RepID=UPI0012FB5A43|nr:hypothetical protein [Syntrophomonas zehnderi]